MLSLNIYTLHTSTIESRANFLFIPYPNTYKNYIMRTILKKKLFSYCSELYNAKYSPISIRLFIFSFNLTWPSITFVVWEVIIA